MPTLQLRNASTLRLPIALAQQLGGIRQAQGEVGVITHYNGDLLAGMQVKSLRAASEYNEAGDQGFRYQAALDQLPGLPVIPDTRRVCQLHHQLHPAGGQLRRVNPRVRLRYHSSGEQLASITGSARIESALTDLLKDLEQSLSEGFDPLLAIPLFTLDFMQIFPFLDGNRRMALLLSRHLLSRHGHSVVSYVDLESEFQTTEKAFYQSLNHSRQVDQPPHRWLAYWWVILMRVYQRFRRQVDLAGISQGRGAKTTLVEHFITQQNQPFLFADISSALPTISPDMIRVVLRKLRDEGRVAASGRGRGTTWSRITPDSP